MKHKFKVGDLAKCVTLEPMDGNTATRMEEALDFGLPIRITEVGSSGRCVYGKVIGGAGGGNVNYFWEAECLIPYNSLEQEVEQL